MLKVFLVEDEIEIRESMKEAINWAEEGFKLCGDAPDGELAYPLIQSEKPDILITDIRMPFMNGLELSHLVKKELPKCKIVILSGYEDFKYAQEAIKIGVAEYLLKPIRSAELIKVVNKIGQQIMLERLAKENSEFYRHELEENERYLKRRFFNEMIEGTSPIAQLISSGRNLGLELSARQYQIVLIQYSGSKVEGSSREALNLTGEFCEMNSGFSDVLHFDRGIDGIALLIKGDSRAEIDETRNHLIERTKTFFDKYPSIHYFGGIGTIVDRLTGLSTSFEQASRALSHRFITDRSSMITDMESFTRNYQDKDASLNMEELANMDLKKIEGFLKSGGTSEVSFFVEEFLRSIGFAAKSYQFKQYILINTYMAVVAFLREIGIANLTLEEPDSKEEKLYVKIHDPHKALDYMIRIITTAISRRVEHRSNSYHRMIEQAKKYIEEHYTEENISLNDAASHVNISPSHFSVVFSRETGKSFIRYITELRMRKAKELLICTDMRCSDISVAVGYKDPHYFSYLFKKLHSCSPVQYRSKQN